MDASAADSPGAETTFRGADVRWGRAICNPAPARKDSHAVMLARRPCLALALVVSVACGGGAATSGPDPKAAEAEAKAKAAEAEDRDEALERRRKEREAKEAAEAKAEADKKAKIDAIAKLPDKLPKKLKTACEQVVEANDAFMKKHYADDPKTLERWNMAKGTQLGMTRQQCIKEGSIEVAACQAHALANAPAELKKDFAQILLACKEKFASGPAEGKAP